MKLPSLPASSQKTRSINDLAGIGINPSDCGLGKKIACAVAVAACATVCAGSLGSACAACFAGLGMGSCIDCA
jgi:hypothetical protein